jgi:tetratricopeptide (TPR) repeat protein
MMERLRLSSAQDVQRAVWLAFAVLIMCLVLFGGYYYWDRYVHPGDVSALEQGVQSLESAIRQDSQDPEVRVVLAEHYLSQRRYEEALDQVQAVLSVYPEHEGALLVASLAHVRMGQPDAALEPLQRFVTLRQDRPLAGTDVALEAAYYFLGESLMQLKRPDDAIPILEAALRITPTDADALYQLGSAYQASGQPGLAVDRYHRASRLVPDFTAVYEGLIESYSALEQSQHVVYAEGMRAWCLEDYDTARDRLERAARSLPDFAPAQMGLGLVYEGLGQFSAALAALDRALEIDPGDYAAQHARGRILASLGSQD